MSARKNCKLWPENCIWPEPTEWSFDFDEDTIPSELDEDAEALLEVGEYFDAHGDGKAPGKDAPVMASDYWDDGFDRETWREDLSNHLNLLKIDLSDTATELICLIQNITGYSFTNENLLRQAFTRRAFAIEYGLEGKLGHPGCSEELEFLGDSVVNSVVTREIIRQFTETVCINVEAPFESQYDEGELTRLRQHFTGKDYLAERARKLGLQKYILYATGEKENDSALEDMMEALIGAIAVDSKWDERILERAVNELLYIQLDTPNQLLEKSFYEVFNAWHQKKIGRMPIYEVHARIGKNDDAGYEADIRFEIPENDRGICISQRMIGEGRTRSLAREAVAWNAYRFVVNHGLWSNLKDAGITPDPENCINQLQELYQKKYLTEKPFYHIEERNNDRWFVTCIVDGVVASGEAENKTKAKKMAAFQVLTKLYSQDRAACVE